MATDKVKKSSNEFNTLLCNTSTTVTNRLSNTSSSRSLNTSQNRSQNTSQNTSQNRSSNRSLNASLNTIANASLNTTSSSKIIKETKTIDDFERLSLVELWQACDQNAMQLMNLINEFIGRRTGHIEHTAFEREEREIEVWRDHSCALVQTDNNSTSIDHIDNSSKSSLNQLNIDKKIDHQLNDSNSCSSKILNKKHKIANLIEDKVPNNKEPNCTQCDNSIDFRQENQENVIDFDKKCNQVKTVKSLKEIKTEDCYNGSDIYDLKTKRLLYSWSQNLSELDLTIPVCLMNKEQCNVLIRSNSLTVRFKENANWITRIDGAMTYSIRPDTAYWTLESGKALRIFLEKVQDRWWSNFLSNEPKLDLNKLEKTIPYDQLTVEEQNVVQKLAYQQIDKKFK